MENQEVSNRNIWSNRKRSWTSHVLREKKNSYPAKKRELSRKLPGLGTNRREASVQPKFERKDNLAPEVKIKIKIFKIGSSRSQSERSGYRLEKYLCESFF